MSSSFRPSSAPWAWPAAARGRPLLAQTAIEPYKAPQLRASLCTRSRSWMHAPIEWRLPAGNGVRSHGFLPRSGVVSLQESVPSTKDAWIVHLKECSFRSPTVSVLYVTRSRAAAQSSCGPPTRQGVVRRGDARGRQPLRRDRAVLCQSLADNPIRIPFAAQMASKTVFNREGMRMRSRSSSLIFACLMFALARLSLWPIVEGRTRKAEAIRAAVKLSTACSINGVFKPWLIAG